ncbi:putative DNA helicase DnaB-like protein [Rhizobium phage RHph_I1_18]|nr:putative DNA helicase DnaB-like protein [Rhizobium phage RHph_I1_18]
MIDNTIISALIHNEQYARRVLPYLRKDYFTEIGHQVLFKLIKDFSTKYNKTPTKESLEIELDNSSLSEGPYNSTQEVLSKLTIADVDSEWLVDQTEQFCKRQALFNAITASADLLSKNDQTNYGSMLGLVQDALAVSFDSNIGHDYLEDLEQRFEFYHSLEETLPCDLSMLNKVCGGGIRNKTMTVFIAPTGGGKTIMLCDLARSYMMQGKNVLYISMEMAAEMISERIDANVLDVPMDMLRKLDKTTFLSKWARQKTKAMGKLVVKQFPNSSAHVGHFRYLLNELKLKKNFKPDVIVVDYLNIVACQSAPKNANSYEKVKMIAEELRGLGVEFDSRIITATQVNREGAGNSDFDLTHTSESFGVPMTADYMFALITTADLERQGRLKIKQLKNRYNDITKIVSFLVNIDRSRMRLWDCDEDLTVEEPEQRPADQVPKTNVEKVSDFNDRFAALIVGDD